MYFYTDSERENDAYSLPNAEVFYAECGEWSYDASGERCDLNDDPDQEVNEAGYYYYWFCFPGCLPDSEPFGPYATEDEAIEACREEHAPCD